MVEQARVCSVIFVCITRKVHDIQVEKQQMFVDEMRVKYLFIIELLPNNGSHQLYTLQRVHCPTPTAPLYTALLPLH